MEFVVSALREHQELAVFVTLAIGFLVGRLRIGSFSLGTVVGTLLAGVAVGQFGIEVPAVVKYIFFAGIKESGLSLVGTGLVIAVLPHVCAILAGRYLLKMNPVIVLGACSGAGTIPPRCEPSRRRRRATSRPWATRCPTPWATSS